ncbi:dTDP-4-dehydrorhamnose reductase [Halalkalibacterium halodurans]|uniref:dTDP-4-dehydrorhamnose reductase n=1 Tax=Halalkalibacterium halodurans TaxID=86665 RepID=UPI002E1BA731|nr:dTDP-4-dehydrorhamnose reductase [Halalkalibacterium halodurans]
MTHLLITGANGQVGMELSKQGKQHFQVTALTKQELNILDRNTVMNKIKGVNPDWIIHAAAFTAVDQCEDEQRKAYHVNGLGAANVARAARETGAKLIYISTDYVFDGNKNSPYETCDLPNPLNVYGNSKWLGERLVQKYVKTCTIARTSWLYGHYGGNFVKTMLRLLRKGEPIEVVADQVGCPTYVNDLVYYLFSLMEKPSGIYHISNRGSCSWFEFARAIAKNAGYDPSLIRATTTKAFAAKARRPKYSVMSHQQLELAGLQPPREWELALKEFIQEETCHD